MAVTARELAEAGGGVVVAGDPAAVVTSFAIDSRVLAPGACFVALAAARDGHDYVADAFQRGATVALVGRELVGLDLPPSRAIVQVDDPLRALGRLAAAARDRLHDAMVVGITGSAGKTGTKDLTAAALARKFHVHASPGSYNNEAGLPLTLLDAPPASEALVLEMGARARGDIAELCLIARPTVGVVTNIGLAHAGPLGGREGVALAKGELLEALGSDGLAVLVADDPATPGLAARTRARVVTVSTLTGLGDARAHSVRLDPELRPSFVLETPWGSGQVQLAIRGAHQVTNAALAAVVALVNGVPFDDVVAGLADVQPAQRRMDMVRAACGALVIDDTYNANPSSMAAAVGALTQVGASGRRIAVLGEMRELGDESEREHTTLGRLVAERGIDVLIAVGAEAEPLAAAARGGATEVHTAPDAAAARDRAVAMVRADDVVLVKGSRAVGLECVVQALTGGGA